MSERRYYDQSDRSLLRSWVLSQMLTGAGWAALVVFGIIGFVLVIRMISWALPDPQAALQTLQAAATALA